MPTPRPAPVRFSPFQALAGVWLLSFLLLVVVTVRRAPLDWPAVFSFDVELPAGAVSESTEPLLQSGEGREADLLLLCRERGGKAWFEYVDLAGARARSEAFAEPEDRRLHLSVSWPAFQHRGPGPQPLVVIVNGRSVLALRVPSQPCDARRLAFGVRIEELPDVAAAFSGRLLVRGKPVAGLAPPAGSDLAARAAFVLQEQPGRLVACALLALLPVFLWQGRAGFARLRPALPARPGLVLMLVSLFLCGGVQAWFLEEGGSLSEPEHFGYFYDYQAKSLLQGRLDVPPEGISGEAFIHDGLSYGYFGPTPALLRIPLELADIGLFARSRLSVLLALALCLVGAHVALRAVWRIVLGEGKEPGAGCVLLVSLNVGLGLPVLLLATRSYVYHEAIAWGTALAILSGAFTLRWLARPVSRSWLPALLLGILSVQARGPVGFFALWFLVCAAVHLALADRRAGSSPRRLGPRALVAVLALAGVASFNLVSLAKFGSLEGCPLWLNVRYTPERLARIDNRLFHADNIPYLTWQYSVGAAPATGGGFPWVGLTAPKPPGPGSAARLDLLEPTVALVWSAPVLLLWSFCGVTAGVLLQRRLRGLWLLAVCAITVPALSLCSVIAISQRYTADFLPGLLLSGLLGLASLAAVGGGWLRRMLQVSGCLSLAAILLSLALCLRYQGEMIYGVNPRRLEQYRSLKTWVDGTGGRWTAEKADGEIAKPEPRR